MSLARRLGINMGRLRTQKKMTQTELARISGVSRATIAEIEGLSGNPALSTIERIAFHYSCLLAYRRYRTHACTGTRETTNPHKGERMKTFYPDNLEDLRKRMDDLLELAQTIVPPTTEEEVNTAWPIFLEASASMMLLSEGAKLTRFGMNPVVSPLISSLSTKLDYPQMRRVKKLLATAEKALGEFFNVRVSILSIPMGGGQEAHEADAERISAVFNRRFDRNPTQTEFLASRMIEVGQRIAEEGLNVLG